MASQNGQWKVLLPKRHHDHCKGQLRPIVQENRSRMEIDAIELLQDLWKELIVIHILLQVLCTFTAIDLVYLLVYRLYGLNELAQGRLKPHPSEESQLCLCIALIPEVRKPFDGGEDRLLLPLRSHFGDEAFIILVDLQGEIDRADKILHRLLLNIGIEQVVPLIQRNSIVDGLLELEGIVELLLPRPHEIDQPPEMPLTNRMLIEPLRLHRSVPLDPARLDRLQLVLFEEPQRLFQHIIITQSLQLFQVGLQFVVWRYRKSKPCTSSMSAETESAGRNRN